MYFLGIFYYKKLYSYVLNYSDDFLIKFKI